MKLLPCWLPWAFQVPPSRTPDWPLCETVTIQLAAFVPLLTTWTIAPYPLLHAGVTVRVAAKEAEAGAAEDRLTCGDGEAECRGDGDAERERDGDTDGEGDGDDGNNEIVGEGDGDSAAATGTVGVDGRTTVGRAASSLDGPTARTATQTTSATRIVTAARKTRRAGLIGGEECLATGNDLRLPGGFREINRLGGAHYPISPSPWHGGLRPG
jgi:hypothetical protein